MTIYATPKASNELLTNRLGKGRRWLIVALVLTLPIDSYLCLNSTEPHSELYRVLLIGSIAVLATLWNPFGRRNVYKEIGAGLRIDSFEVDPAGLKINGVNWSKFVPWNEVAQIEEPANGRGMYIRTRRRLLWYLISRKTDRYEEMRGELAAIGIPIAQRPAPWNWGMLFVALYCASLLCNLLTQDRRILACNFAVALTLAIAGATLTDSGFGDRRFRTKSMLGSFLPAVFSAVSLIFPFGVK